MRLIPDRGTPRVVLWIALGLMALLQALLLYREFHVGEYVGAIPWDDCSILDLALLRLARASAADSVLGLVKVAQDLAAHSPIADYQTMVGLLFSGGQMWAPFALNIVLPAVALSLAWVGMRDRAWPVAVALVMMFVFTPVTVFALTNLKADWKGAILVAASIFLFFEALETGKPSRWILASALLGLAVLCKLTAFYMPPLALVVLLTFHLADIAQDKQVCANIRKPVVLVAAVYRALITRLDAILLHAALVVVPFGFFFAYGSVSHFNTINYIHHALGQAWVDGLTWPQRMVVYAPGMNPAWGPLGWLLPAAVVGSLVVWWRRRDTAFFLPVALLVVVGGVFFFPLSIAKTSNVEFGATMVGVFLGFVLVMAARLGSSSRAAGVVVLVLAFAAAATTPFNQYRREIGEFERGERAYAVRTYHRVVDDIVRLRKAEDTSLDVFYEDSIVPYPNLALYFFDKTGRYLKTSQVQEMPAPAPDGRYNLTGEFALVLKPNRADPPVGYQPILTFPATRNAGEVQRFVSGLSDVKLVSEYPWKNGSVQLFQRLPSTPLAEATAPPAPVDP